VDSTKRLIAKIISAKPLAAIPVAAPSAKFISNFNFNAKLQALPAALQALNAQYTNNSVKNVPQHAVNVTNLCLRSTLEGGGAAPTGWTQPSGTGTSAPAVSTLGTANNAVAYLQSATAQRPFIAQSIAVSANTTYTYSVFIESVSSGIKSNTSMFLEAATVPAGATVTYPACEANPNGGTGSDITTGRLLITLVTVAASGTPTLRIGLGVQSAATGSIQFSRPQLETGTVAHDWVPTTSAAVAVIQPQAALGLVSLAANQFGTSYDSVTGLYGYDAQPAATNLALRSSELSNAGVWASASNLTVTPDQAVAPDGTTTADLIAANSGVSAYLYQSISGSVITYTISFFVKAGNSRYVYAGIYAGADKGVILDTQTGTITSTTGAVSNQLVAPVGQFFRVSYSFTGAATILLTVPRSCASAISILPVLTGTCYVWGAQLETGSRATSYIATGAATASRAADVLSVPLWVNRLKYSQDMSNAVWVKGAGLTKTDNYGVAPDGTTTSTRLANLGVGANKGVYQYCPSTASEALVPSIYIKKASSAGIISLENPHNTIHGRWTIDLSLFPAGWTRVALGVAGVAQVYAFNQPEAIVTGQGVFLFANTDVDVEVWGAQLEAGSTATAYRPTTGNLEYARNLHVFSQEFDNAAWIKDGATIGAGTTPPAGVTASQKLLETATSGAHRIYSNAVITVASNGTMTLSCYAKAAERTSFRLGMSDLVSGDASALFDLTNGTTSGVAGLPWAGTTASAVSVGGGWYRCILTSTRNNTGSGARAFLSLLDGVGSVTSGVYIAGAQLEAGAISAYEPTNTITPSANANLPGFSSAGYTLFADVRRDVAATTDANAVTISDGTYNNWARVYTNSDNLLATAVVSGGVTQGSLATGAAGTPRRKVAYSVAANSLLGAADGTARTADTSAAVPVSPAALKIGTGATTSEQFNGFLFRAGLVPAALTQAQINGMTS